MHDVANTNDARTAYDREGDGPALLLMHGAESSRHQFDSLTPLLNGALTTIAYDQRDCGDTENPPRPATLAELADDAASLIDALGFERAHVFGSSYGGRVAQALAIRHPHRVDRLVLGSTWPLPEPLQAFNPVGFARLVALRARLPDSAEELATMFFPAAFLEEEPSFKKLFAHVTTSSERSRRRSAAIGSSIVGDPSKIVAQTLLLTGALDEVVPASVTLSIATQLRRCEQVVLDGVGHVTVLQKPQAVAGHLMRFLLSA